MCVVRFRILVLLITLDLRSMGKIVLYPVRKHWKQDFSNDEVLTVPDQSMSLKTILERFTRRESLPIEKKGVYAEGLGDLEKMVKQDPVDLMEMAVQMKEQADGFKASEDKAAADKKAADELAAKEEAEFRAAWKAGQIKGPDKDLKPGV